MAFISLELHNSKPEHKNINIECNYTKMQYKFYNQLVLLRNFHLNNYDGT